MKRCINAPGGPPAVGPYSHATEANGFLFLSGQLALAPDGSGPQHGTIEEETTLALENIRAILEDAGSSMEHIVKTTVFLKDMADFGAFNRVYEGFMGVNPPARSCVQVGQLPLDMRVEIEVVALAPTG